jgi:hypothetical protein
MFHLISASTSTACNSTNMDPINEAIEEINSLEEGKTFSYKAIAEKYGVVRSTLTRQHQGVGISASQQDNLRHPKA